MGKRQYGNNMPHRQGVTTYLQDLINRKVVHHFDAWLYQMPDDVLYFLIETRAGGEQLLTRNVFRACPLQGLVPVRDPGVVENGIKRTIDGPRAKVHWPYCAAIHKRDIAPHMRVVPAGFKLVSTRLHYIYTNRKIDDPMEGIENLYAATARAGRDKVDGISIRDARRIAAINGTPAPKSPWTARERSILRTLDKILR